MSGSAAAVVISSVALAEAENARTEACKATIAVFDSKAATVAETQAYAACVQRVYPSNWTTDQIWIAKGVFVLALIGLALGIWWARKENEDWSGALLFGLLWFLCLPVAVAFVVGVVMGIGWLFI